MAIWNAQLQPSTTLEAAYSATSDSTITNASVCNTSSTETTITIVATDGATPQTKYHNLTIAANASGVSLGLLVNMRLPAGFAIQAQVADASTVTLSMSGERSG